MVVHGAATLPTSGTVLQSSWTWTAAASDWLNYRVGPPGDPRQLFEVALEGQVDGFHYSQRASCSSSGLTVRVSRTAGQRLQVVLRGYE